MSTEDNGIESEYPRAVSREEQGFTGQGPESASTDDQDLDSDDDTQDDSVYYEEDVEPEQGILGFTLRELILLGTWAVLFIVSFFQTGPLTPTVWKGLTWILPVGLPTVAVFLVALRRFSPQGIRRVGSLGIDQFASVAAAVSAVSWAEMLWNQVAASITSGLFLVGWVPVVALLAALGLIACTVAAPLIPRLRQDFEGRMETLAHRNANPVRPVISRPLPERRAQEVAVADSNDDEDVADLDQTDDAEPGDISSTDGFAPAAADAPYGDDDADATRVIPRLNLQDPAELITPSVEPVAGPVVSEPVVEPSNATAAELPVESIDESVPELSAAEVADTWSSPSVAAEEPRDAGIAYTDPLGALDDIFAAQPAPGETSSPETQTDTTAASDGSTAEPAVVSHTADSAADETGRRDSTDAPLRRTRNEQNAAAAEAGPFWILAGSERDVLDEQGLPIFRIGPSAWALVIEDRGGAYVVRHDDGRIGYLHDLTDITKG